MIRDELWKRDMVMAMFAAALVPVTVIVIVTFHIIRKWMGR